MKRRTIAAVALAALSLLLLWADSAIPGVQPGEKMTRIAAAKLIGAAVDTVCARHGIPASDVKSWRASAAGAPLERIEQRAGVGPGFFSLLVNHELQKLVAPAGAHVVATERTKENAVTMHIVRNGATVRSISFVLILPQ